MKQPTDFDVHYQGLPYKFGLRGKLFVWNSDEWVLCTTVDHAEIRKAIEDKKADERKAAQKKAIKALDKSEPKKKRRKKKQKTGPFRPIESAPKVIFDGCYDHEQQQILLLFNSGAMCVGYWSWYYSEQGAGYEGGEAWAELFSGERIEPYYGKAIGWMSLPEPALIKQPSRRGKDGTWN